MRNTCYDPARIIGMRATASPERIIVVCAGKHGAKDTSRRIPCLGDATRLDVCPATSRHLGHTVRAKAVRLVHVPRRLRLANPLPPAPPRLFAGTLRPLRGPRPRRTCGRPLPSPPLLWAVGVLPQVVARRACWFVREASVLRAIGVLLQVVPSTLRLVLLAVLLRATAVVVAVLLRASTVGLRVRTEGTTCVHSI